LRRHKSGGLASEEFIEQKRIARQIQHSVRAALYLHVIVITKRSVTIVISVIIAP